MAIFKAGATFSKPSRRVSMLNFGGISLLYFLLEIPCQSQSSQLQKNIPQALRKKKLRSLTHPPIRSGKWPLFFEETNLVGTHSPLNHDSKM